MEEAVTFFWGRITLSNLPVYYMSLFRMSKIVVAKLVRIRRNFMWEGQGKRRKIHLLKWCVVIKLKRDGGLGLGSLGIKNWALLAKR